MSWQVNLSEQAEADLRAIFSYIAFELLSLENASAQLDRLEQKINSLSELPERYRRYETEPWRTLGVRRLSVDHYRVFYLPNSAERTVDVLRILYAGSDLDRGLEETELPYEK